MKLVRYSIVVTLLLVYFVPVIVLSQPDNPTNDPDPVPITGIEILIAAGALLGVKKFSDYNKKRKP